MEEKINNINNSYMKYKIIDSSKNIFMFKKLKDYEDTGFEPYELELLSLILEDNNFENFEFIEFIERLLSCFSIEDLKKNFVSTKSEDGGNA